MRTLFVFSTICLLITLSGIYSALEAPLIQDMQQENTSRSAESGCPRCELLEDMLIFEYTRKSNLLLHVQNLEVELAEMREEVGSDELLKLLRIGKCVTTVPNGL